MAYFSYNDFQHISCFPLNYGSHKVQKLALSQGADEEMAEKLEALALERGEPQNASNVSDPLPIIEKESDQVPKAPSLGRKQDLVEGHQPRKVRFQNA